MGLVNGAECRRQDDGGEEEAWNEQLCSVRGSVSIMMMIMVKVRRAFSPARVLRFSLAGVVYD